MLNNSLLCQWFNHYEKVLIKEFDLDVSQIEGYNDSFAPLIYCCLLHKRLPRKRWNIIESEEFKQSSFVSNADFLKFRESLESGQNIDVYQSKKYNDFLNNDHLLYSMDIHHFHLKKNGVGKDLIFAVVKDDNFYILAVGDHLDLYKADTLIQIICNNWGIDFFNNYKNINSEDFIPFNQQVFKLEANHKGLQFNYFSPIQFSHDGNLYSLNNNQNTIYINFELNSKNFKVPLQCFCAYVNEDNFIAEIEKILEARYHHTNFKINFGDEIIEIINPSLKPLLQKIDFFKVSPDLIMVSNYHKRNYFPYTL